MRFLSVCSGIEAASVAWEPLGWKAVAFSEIEPFPCAVLAHHYPDTPNWGDMTKYKDWPDVSIDLLCGGTPCQSFSVAGLRKGLDDPRGNLMLTFGAIAAKYRPKWLVWENVPGVLSSNGGADFGAFLGMLGQLGYGFAYRVLDAQYFGVAQRRRRVFVVGCLGDWRSAAAVLFERHSLQGHPAPSRQAGKAAPTIPSRSTAGGGLGTDFDCDGGLIASVCGQDGADMVGTITAGFGGNKMGAPEVDAGLYIPVVGTLNANGKAAGSATQQDAETGMLVPMLDHALRGEGFDASEDGTGRGTPLVPVAFAENSRHELRLEGGDGQRTGALSTGGGKPGQGVPMIAFPANLSGTQCASTEELAPSMGASNPTGVAYGIRTANTSSNGWGIQEECTHTLDCAQGVAVAQPVAHAIQAGALRVNPASGPGGVGVQADHAYTLEARAEVQAVQSAMQVRRLTPMECERLQGFPDGYTKVPHRNKPAADGPRYKALGNSWAVPNVRWIGQRIDAVALVNTAQPAIKPVAEREAA